jgi:hypothetical protein
MVGMLTRLAAIMLLVACSGDDTRKPDARLTPTGPTDDLPVNPGEGCANFDINVICPPTPDAAVDDTDTALKAACCHALEDGQPPKFECGYPPGICHSGRHDLHCGSLTFTLCNP